MRFSSICSVHNLLVRWKWEITHPAVFNSFPDQVLPILTLRPIAASRVVLDWGGCRQNLGPETSFANFFLLPFKASSRPPDRGTERFLHLDKVVCTTQMSCQNQG